VTTVAPFGSWRPPIDSVAATAGLAAGQIAAPSYVGLVDGEAWWVEPRPAEEGRSALVPALSWKAPRRMFDSAYRHGRDVAGTPPADGEIFSRPTRRNTRRQVGTTGPLTTLVTLFCPSVD